MRVRDAIPTDYAAVATLLTEGFGRSDEADLVAALREQVSPRIDLVAVDEDTVAGHVLLTPVTLPGRPDARLMGLGPMVVMPACQRQGVGGTLVAAGLQRCRQLGQGAVVVLGHAEYYLRFGFVSASRLGLTCVYDVPDDVFMARELIPGYLTQVSGTVQYPPAFNAVPN